MNKMPQPTPLEKFIAHQRLRLKPFTAEDLRSVPTAATYARRAQEFEIAALHELGNSKYYAAKADFLNASSYWETAASRAAKEGPKWFSIKFKENAQIAKSNALLLGLKLTLRKEVPKTDNSEELTVQCNESAFKSLKHL